MAHIGLLFGSFNPVHIGHLALANYMREMHGMGEVWFVVSPQNPFKQSSDLIDCADRLKMVEIALGGHRGYRACDVEFTLPIPSYTINTLNKLEGIYPDNQFSILMGSDNIQNIDKWKQSSEIIATHQLFVYPRPEFPVFDKNLHPNITITQAPLLDLSSTFIREQLKCGKNMCFFLPHGVDVYIMEKGLYPI